LAWIQANRDDLPALGSQAQVLLAGAIAVVLAAAVLTLLVRAPTAGKPAGDGIDVSTANPLDVSAARACRTYLSFLQGNAKQQAVTDAASPLVAGSAEARASGAPAPRWADLGNLLLKASGDRADAGASAETIKADNEQVSAACNSVPAAAKKAGGYTS
jgi:hypothetical protein